MIIRLIESWFTGWSRFAQNSTHTNSVSSSNTRGIYKAAIDGTAETAIPCQRFRDRLHSLGWRRNGKFELLWRIFHVRTGQVLPRFSRGGVSEFWFLKYFSEFCGEERVRSHLDIYPIVEYFSDSVAWSRLCEIYAGIGNASKAFACVGESWQGNPATSITPSALSKIFCQIRTHSAMN